MPRYKVVDLGKDPTVYPDLDALLNGCPQEIVGWRVLLNGIASPMFRELVGPMINADDTIRYETPAAYKVLSQ